MQILVQEKHHKIISDIIREIDHEEHFEIYTSFDKVGAQKLDLIAGELDYLEKFLNFDAQKVLLTTSLKADTSKVHEFSKFSKIYFAEEKNKIQLSNLLNSIKSETEKKSQINKIKIEIQRKRRELEQLNNQLSAESEKKIESLELSHIEETEKNQKEKSLLHFLDFIQSESIGDDFIEKMFRFIWKDLKKSGRLNLIGLSMTTHSGKSKIIFYDGTAESTSIATVNFSEASISAQLALVWGRPVAKIMSWELPESSRESFLFVEVVDGAPSQEKISNYMAERLAVLSMYLDRWMIEKEIEVVVDRWKNTFKSFSGSTHVIDENFKIYQSNYTRNGGDHCYKVLAQRNSPCVMCPILMKKNSNFILKDELSVKTYYSHFKFQDKNYYFVIYEDVTKLNQLHSQIIQTEKMSTLGRLGNHLAHELNNPLTGIKSYVQTLLEDSKSMSQLPNTAKTDLNEILKAAVRCQKIIKNFIDFSQKKEPVLEKSNFAEIVQNTVILLKTALRNHRLYVDLKNNEVIANAHDLQQVLFNLIKNSCQAMQQNSGPGTIKIYEEVINTAAGQKIYFHVEDTGPGFSEHILKNIFQPFMTTKEQGEGTGLGLYLSKKLMNNMNADLQITSSSEKGAKISLIFDKI